MNKYKIEGNIDFFEELYKSLVIDDTDDNTNNICLISNTPLADKFVELKCGHKFNYIPLYNDIVNHKKYFNNMEGSTSQLKLNEIRCPYCRNKQDTLLPYYEELGLHKVNGVNFYQDTGNKKTNTCQYEIINENFDDKLPESNSNKKYINCCKPFSYQIIEYSAENPWEPKFTYQDEKYYCYEHKKIMIKKYKLENKQKLIEEKKQVKVQLKAEKVKAKEEEKVAKQKEKEELKKSKQKTNENIVLGPLVIGNATVGCAQNLKTGVNKGNVCGCKIFAENLCKRHYSLINKELIINN